MRLSDLHPNLNFRIYELCICPAVGPAVSSLCVHLFHPIGWQWIPPPTRLPGIESQSPFCLWCLPILQMYNRPIICQAMMLIRTTPTNKELTHPWGIPEGWQGEWASLWHDVTGLNSEHWFWVSSLWWLHLSSWQVWMPWIGPVCCLLSVLLCQGKSEDLLFCC